jgi:hypothetical protein
MDLLLSTIFKGIEARKNNCKNDAYFNLPEDLTIDQIKQLQKTIESTNQTKCRLYSRYRLQVYWDYMPKRSATEFLYNLGATHDIDEQIKMFEITSKLNPFNKDISKNLK